MRLYFLYCFHNDLEFITIDKDSVLYFMRTLGIRDNRGSKPENIDLENKLNIFYQNDFLMNIILILWSHDTVDSLWHQNE